MSIEKEKFIRTADAPFVVFFIIVLALIGILVRTFMQ